MSTRNIQRKLGLNPKKSLGQGMTEYIIIVALIAIAAIGVFRLFGDTARSQVAVMAQELGGQSSAESETAAKAAADAAGIEGNKDKTLADFGQNDEKRK